MSSYINYIILKEKNLIVEYYAGDIYKQDFLDYYQRKANDVNYNSNFNLLIDFRDSQIHLSKEDVYELSQFISNNPILNGSRYAAHITNSPNQVVSGIKFDIYRKNLPVKIKIFSTLAAALSWVKLPPTDQHELEVHLNALKENR